MWADRVVASSFADRGHPGFATRADLERIRDGWLARASAEDGYCPCSTARSSAAPDALKIPVIMI